MSLSLTTIYQPSEHVEQRSRLMWATIHERGQFTVTYKVVPHGKEFEHKSKDRRLVRFDLRRELVECLSLESGEVCEANSFGRLCGHVLAAHKSMKANVRRQETIENRRAA